MTLPRFVSTSVGWHAAMGIGATLAPATWPWWLGGIAANHVLIAAAGMTPRSRWIGPNISRLPATARAAGQIALTFDDGPDPEVTPTVLDILAQAKARATFFCIGERLARHPKLARRILAEGHMIENHTQRHSHRFAFGGQRAFLEEIGNAQETAQTVTGRLPRFFRAPAGMRNPFLQPALEKLELNLVSWTRRGFDTRETNPTRVLNRLQNKLAAGDILLLHDGHAARDPLGQPVVVTVLPALIAQIQRQSLNTVTLEQAMA